MTDTELSILGVIIIIISGLLVLALSEGGHIKIGPFEIGKSNKKFNKQIEDIATIVENQNKDTNKSLVKTFAQVMTSSVPPGPIISPFFNYTELTKKLLNSLESKKTKEVNTWSLVEGLINSYHKQALRQASIQFWFSLIAAVVGFTIVLYAFLFPSEKGAMDITFKALPGIMIDLVAALFFRQAEQTRQRATDLYDRLRNDNQRTIAIDLIDSIEDENLRSVVKAQLALKIGGVEATIQDLSTLSTTNNKAI